MAGAGVSLRGQDHLGGVEVAVALPPGRHARVLHMASRSDGLTRRVSSSSESKR